MSGPIAITGVTGFIGRRVAALLAETGVPVRALVRRPAKLDEASSGSLDVIVGDLLDPAAVERLSAGAAAVIHCAGALSSSGETLFAVNVEGTRRLAEAARDAGVPRFVHVSSVAAREPGLSDYANSKRQGEKALTTTLDAARWVILRPPAVYGPGDKSTLPLMSQLTRSTAWLPGTRSQRLSVIYVDDLARALIGLSRTTTPAGTVHELHDGRPGGYGWADFAEAAATVQGRPVAVRHLPQFALAGLARVAPLWPYFTGKPLKPKLNPGKVRELYHADWVCRNDLLDRVFEWRPEVGFAQGLARTVEWYRHKGWLPPEPPLAMRQAGAARENP